MNAMIQDYEPAERLSVFLRKQRADRGLKAEGNHPPNSGAHSGKKLMTSIKETVKTGEPIMLAYNAHAAPSAEAP